MSDEDMIDWDALLAEGTETNEANVDSVATLDRDHDDTVTYDWDDDPSVFAEHVKAVMDECDNHGYATSSTVEPEAVDAFLLATFGAKKGKRGLTGEQLQQLHEAFAADEKGNPARYAALATSVGGGCTPRQVESAFSELRRESGTVQQRSANSGRKENPNKRSGISPESGNIYINISSCGALCRVRRRIGSREVSTCRNGRYQLRKTSPPAEKTVPLWKPFPAQGRQEPTM